MISEKQLAESFDSFWQYHFPLLNPQFVRRMNAEDRERLVAKDGSLIPPVPMRKDVGRFDLVAELAYEFALEAYKKRFGDTSNIPKATQRALKRISALEGCSEVPDPTKQELADANLLLHNYEHLFDMIASEGIIRFRPRIKGTGILGEMEADFCTTSTLFEAKAVNRNLQWIDLRQVVCYLVTGLGSCQYSWSHYCIFNPRLSVYYSGEVPELLSYLSGKSAPECISEVLDVLSEREQPLESLF